MFHFIVFHFNVSCWFDSDSIRFDSILIQLDSIQLVLNQFDSIHSGQFTFLFFQSIGALSGTFIINTIISTSTIRFVSVESSSTSSILLLGCTRHRPRHISSCSSCNPSHDHKYRMVLGCTRHCRRHIPSPSSRTSLHYNYRTTTSCGTHLQCRRNISSPPPRTSLDHKHRTTS